MDSRIKEIEYCIFDPTGNITALVETEVDVPSQPEVAAEIMRRHSDVEQVGFVRMYAPGEGPGGASVYLRMAGGEFCGNATMSSAALFAKRNEEHFGDIVGVSVAVDGISKPFSVELRREDASSWAAGVLMPPAKSIDELRMTAEDYPAAELGNLPVVRMDGIDHIMIGEKSFYYNLKDNRALTESLIRKICRVLDSECLGMMFFADGERERELTPLVFVPGADTMFWENSCASGTVAAGQYLAAKAGEAVSAALKEPGGTLVVESDPETGETWLFGGTKLRDQLTLKLT
jgi:diaminopimelate epimerase